MSNTLNISGVALDFDILDADTLARVDRAMETVVADTAGIDPALPEADKIRKLCGILKRCFDEIFGAGTAEKLFGAADNLDSCVTAFLALAQNKRKQAARWANRMDRTTARLSGAAKAAK